MADAGALPNECQPVILDVAAHGDISNKTQRTVITVEFALPIKLVPIVVKRLTYTAQMI